MINGAGEGTFERLVSILGPLSAYEFLEATLPEIIERNSTLQVALVLQDYDQAIKYANQSLGAVRFFGSEELEQLLLVVAHEMDSNDPVDIRNKLSIAFEAVIVEINTWLIEHEPLQPSLNYQPR